MKTTSKLIIGAGAIACTLVGFAFATPIVNLASPLLAVGTHNADVETHGTGRTASGQEFSVHLRTEGPMTVSIQDGAFNAGGHNGWHSHPGMVSVTLLSGSIQWYDENCEPTVYHAGDTWVEGSQPHYFRLIGTGGVHLMAVFLTAQGAALRTDEAAPSCAVALGLT